jgi:type IV pilus assembly protein PilB
MQSSITGIRRAILLKVISKPQPSREDVDSVIELTSSRVVELLKAQSMTFYLLDGNEITFKHVYYSPSLWDNNNERQREFAARKAQLMQLRLPVGTGVVGEVLKNGKPVFFQASKDAERMHSMTKSTGFNITSMLTVPLKGLNRNVGAIQVLNKEQYSGSTEFGQDDLRVLEEVAEYSAPLIQRMLDPKFQIDDTDTARFIAQLTDTELVTSADQIQIDEKLIEVVGDAVIRRDKILPYKRLGPNTVAALVTNPMDYPKQESFQIATELQIDEIKVAPFSLIESICKKFLRQESMPQIDNTDMAELADVIGSEYSERSEGDAVDRELQDEESAPIIQLANRIIEDAYISGASDIHIEPQETDLTVRYRIDGICHEKLRLPRKVSGSLIARLKIMSGLNIAERRLPQDGRIVFKQFTKKNIDIDLRVAIGPMNFGEKVVMRILDKSKAALPITSLGFSEANLTQYRELIQQPYGMILHCGPTGSGKSMTLFSALREIASPEINIQTAEDPIEYTIPGINQMQMHKQIGLTFASALRCYLRMDPDIILVGEIRDVETAAIAVEAALTGHLLLSTLHTNDAPSTIARFADMEIEPFMISSSLLCVCAQRLMRRICKNCKESYLPEGNEKQILENAIGWSGEIYRARENGCVICGGNGMKGRVGIHELMANNEELTKAINQGVETAELKRIAMRTGMKSLHQDSMLKVKEGTSTMIESLSNVPPDMIHI